MVCVDFKTSKVEEVEPLDSQEAAVDAANVLSKCGLIHRSGRDVSFMRALQSMA